MPSPKRRKQKNTLSVVGRRKTSTACIFFLPGEGSVEQLVVNGKSFRNYFPTHLSSIPLQPFQLVTDPPAGQWHVKVSGGGIHSQAEAVRHGIARLLILINPQWRTLLKAKGYLTRDPRMKERKKPGFKRARRAPQWSKR